MKLFQRFHKSGFSITLLVVISGAGLLLAGCQKSVDVPDDLLQANAMGVNAGKHQKNIPFKVHFLATVEAIQAPAPPDVLLIHRLFGTFTGMHVGKASYDSYVAINVFGDLPLSGTATATITAANGDQIFMDQTGIITPDGHGGATVAINATITGGTGRFSQASGTLTGTVASVSETTDSVSLEGSLSY